MSSATASAIFRSEPQTYMRRMALLWLSRCWLFMLIPFIAVAVWSVYDVRALIVGLMMLFIVYPMALSVVWFNYSLSPQSRRAVAGKVLVFGDGGMDLTFLPAEEGAPALQPQHIGWSDVVSVSRTARSVELRLGSRLDDFLEIPAEAFPEATWQSFFTYLPESSDDVDAF